MGAKADELLPKEHYKLPDKVYVSNNVVRDRDLNMSLFYLKFTNDLL